MCYNCGCRNPDDDMGDVNNITTATLNHLSEHWGKTLPQTKIEVLKMLESGKVSDAHLVGMFEKASRAWGQSIDEAKKNTASLLKEETGK